MTDQKSYLPEGLCLGYPSIDAQHEVLFVIHRELTHALRNEEDGFDLADIFSGLNGYVATHFKHEEVLMLSTRFHGAAAHTQEHRQLENDVAEWRRRFSGAQNKEEKRAIAQNVAEFLADWLGNHIAKTDRLLVEYLAGHTVD